MVQPKAGAGWSGLATGPAVAAREDTMISKEDQTSLIWLQWHWDKHYVIKIIDGTWQAHPADRPLVVLAADSAMDLRDLMRDDYATNKAGRR